MKKKILTLCSLMMVFASVFWGYGMDVQAETNHWADAVKAVNLPSNGLDVMLVVDNSKSVWSQQEVRNEALRCIGSLAVGGDINMGCVYFADHLCNTQMKLQSMKDISQAKNILAQPVFHMKEQDMGNIDTNIGVGLKSAVDAFADQNPSRKRAVILFSDGINENLAGNSAYKKAADALTREQVQLLKEKNVEIYCVYLQKRDSRENVKYLKQLVNYFEDTDYTEERFKSVKEDEIDTLSEEFVKIFYAVQNGMKYKPIDLSAGGKTSFYIPSMGVNRLQIFLKNDNPMEVTLKCLEESGHVADSWQDGGNAFISVDDPAPGQWELTVSGTDADQTTGTIAYYTDISCYTELEDISGSSSIHKNSRVRLKSVFYNHSGKEIVMDKAAGLEGIICYIDENRKVRTDRYPLQVTEEGAYSEEFMIENYGSHIIGVNIVYDEFVNLTYPMPTFSVTPNDFAIFPISAGKFEGYKSSDGYRFTIKESDLIRDPEGETITLVKVSQGNQNNPVQVELKDGYFIVKAKETGDLQFTVSVADESGMTGTVSVEGKLRNKQVVDIMKGVMYGLILILVILEIRNTIKKAKLKKEIKEMKQEFKKDCGEAVENMDRFDLEASVELYGKYGVMKEDILDYKNDTVALAAFGMTKYVEENLDELFREEMVEIITNAEAAKQTIEHLQKKADNIVEKGSLHVLEKRLSQLTGLGKKLNSMNSEMDVLYQTYREKMDAMNEEIDFMQEKFFEFDDMMQEVITSTMKVRVNNGDYRGKLTANNHTGYYSLVDDVKLLSRSGKHIETLTSLIGNQIPNIIVYNYQNDDGEEGLVLRSADAFEIKEAAFNTSGETVHQYNLMKGCAYKMTIRGMGYIELEVE